MHIPILTVCSPRRVPTRLCWSRRRTAMLAVVCALLGACHRAPPASASASTQQPEPASAPNSTEAAAGTPENTMEGVTLTPGQAEKLGLVTQPARPTEYSRQVSGYGFVIGHETIAQAVAELATTRATEQLSRSVLRRAQQLSGTPGAVSADVEEAAVRQAAVDRAALELARERLSTMVGRNPPWRDTDESLLDALGSGRIKLVRATFPLGAIEGVASASLRLARIDADRSSRSWKSTAAWDAPADSSVPGRSFFALLKGSDAAEGERLLAWAPVGAPEVGVAIPAAALIISDNKYWCYLERKPGVFRRVEIDTLRPLADGYFVTTGVAAGEKIVTESAGLLLAREMNPGTAAD